MGEKGGKNAFDIVTVRGVFNLSIGVVGSCKAFNLSSFILKLMCLEDFLLMLLLLFVLASALPLSIASEDLFVPKYFEFNEPLDFGILKVCFKLLDIVI